MRTTEIPTPTTAEAQHYLDLHYTMLRSNRDYYEGKNYNIEIFEDKNYESLVLPKDLSDQDKFISVLLSMYSSDIGLTTKRLIDWFGWTKYRCYKNARECKYCRTVTLICEEGGYGGTGWVLMSEMNDAMRKIIEEKYPCRECKYLTRIQSPELFHKKPFSGMCAMYHRLFVYENSGCCTGMFEKKEVDNPF